MSRLRELGWHRWARGHVGGSTKRLLSYLERLMPPARLGALISTGDRVGAKARFTPAVRFEVMSGDLIELVYLSAATRPFTVTELRDLLVRSRRNNRALAVTGLLLHAGGSFLQVIEGPELAVDGLYTRIRNDDRHGQVVRVFRRDIVARSFPNWTMGYAEPTPAMRSELLGFTTALSAGADGLPDNVSEGVRSIVEQFANGRWQQANAPSSSTRPRSC